MVIAKKHFLLFASVAALFFAGASQAAPFEPVLVNTDYDLLPQYVAACDVRRDFGARGDGKTDDTQAFLAAVDYVRGAGGGSITVPEGRYIIKKQIVLPASVYLVGRWYNPDREAEKAAQGSVLCCMTGKGEDRSHTKPFIQIGAGAGVIGLTIWYPEQNPQNPVVYPATLGACDMTNDRGASGFATIRYVTLVNPYWGIDLGPEKNECHLVNEVFMSPLRTGIEMEEISDIGRIQGVHIAAKYWPQFDGTVSAKTVEHTMKSQTEGIVMRRSDWQHTSEVYISDVFRGIVNRRFTNLSYNKDSCNSTNAKLRMSNVATGFYFEYANKQGTKLYDVEIETDGSPGSACICFSAGFNGSATILGGRLSNPGGACIVAEKGARGAFTVSAVCFERYKGCAVELEGSSAAVFNCRFEEADAAAIHTGSAISSASMGANRYAGTPCLNNAPDRTHIDSAPYSPDTLWRCEFTAGRLPTAKREAMADITGAGYGAKKSPAGELKNDITATLQRALNDMGKAGGGVVFVPAGFYRVSGTLTVPEGVELRGVSNGNHHSSALGTVLFSTWGRAQPDGTAFITLCKGSGVNGLLVWYPEQSIDRITAYPYAIRAEGEGVWVVNVTLGNAFNGVDLSRADCGGHVIYGLSGNCFKNILAIDRSTRPGMVALCHFNTHFLTRRRNLPWKSESSDLDYFRKKVFGYMEKNLDCMVLGRTSGETIYDFFVFKCANGVVMKQGAEGGFFDGRFIYAGFDAFRTNDYDIRVATDRDLCFYLTETNGRGFGSFYNAGGGKFRFYSPSYNLFNAAPATGFELAAGAADIRSGYFRVSNGVGTLRTKGADACIRATGCIFNHVGKVFPDNSGFALQPAGEVKDVANDGGRLDFRYNIGISHFGAVAVGDATNITAYHGEW